jgi:hypothetical protein
MSDIDSRIETIVADYCGNAEEMARRIVYLEDREEFLARQVRELKDELDPANQDPVWQD